MSNYNYNMDLYSAALQRCQGP